MVVYRFRETMNEHTVKAIQTAPIRPRKSFLFLFSQWYCCNMKCYHRDTKPCISHHQGLPFYDFLLIDISVTVTVSLTSHTIQNDSAGLKREHKSDRCLTFSHYFRYIFSSSLVAEMRCSGPELYT